MAYRRLAEAMEADGLRPHVSSAFRAYRVQCTTFLRWVGRVRKRSILLSGQAFAVVGGLPLLAYGALAAAGGGLAPAVAGTSMFRSFEEVAPMRYWQDGVGYGFYSYYQFWYDAVGPAVSITAGTFLSLAISSKP